MTTGHITSISRSQVPHFVKDLMVRQIILMIIGDDLARKDSVEMVGEKVLHRIIGETTEISAASATPKCGVDQLLILSLPGC